MGWGKKHGGVKNHKEIEKKIINKKYSVDAKRSDVLLSKGSWQAGPQQQVM